MLINSPELSFTSYLDKMPPAELDAERYILGAVLSNSEDTFSVVKDKLPVEAFASEIHQKVYRAMHVLYKQERVINLLTVVGYFSDRNTLSSVGGKIQMASYLESYLGYPDLKTAVDVVLDKYIRRCVVGFGNELIERSYDDYRETSIVLDHLRKKAESLLNNGIGKSADERDFIEFSKLKKAISDIELNISDPSFKAYKLQKLASDVGKSHRQLEQIYLKSLCDFSDQPRKTIARLRQECGKDEREWLLHGFLPKATTILLHAEGGVGKTKLAYEFAYNLINGTNWSGFPVTGKHKVLAYQTDESPHDMRHALDERGFTDDMNYEYRDNWVIDAIPRLVADIKEFHPDFIIIDSLTSVSRYSIFSENDTEYARPVLELAQIAKEYGCTILVLHHSNGDGGSRGTRAIFNSVSEVWNLKVDKTEGASNLERLLKIEKSRSRAPSTYRLRFDPDNYSWHCLGQENGVSSDVNNQKAILDFLCKNRNVPYEAEEIQVHTGIPTASARRILGRLASEGVISKRNRGIKRKPNTYFVAENSDHTQELVDQNEFPVTIGDTANADHPPQIVITGGDQNFFGSQQGIQEMLITPLQKRGGSDSEADEEKLQTPDQHSLNPLHSKEKILITPLNQNADHPPSDQHSSTSKGVDLNPLITNLKETGNIHPSFDRSKNQLSVNGLTDRWNVKYRFGATHIHLEYEQKDGGVKGRSSEFIQHSPKLTFKQFREKVEAAVWKLEFDSLTGDRDFKVEQIVHRADDCEKVWVEGCKLVSVPNPPTDTMFTLKKEDRIIRVAGIDELELE